MANLAANPSLWKDSFGGTPPTWWTGSAYVCDDTGNNGIGLVMSLINPPDPGDTFSVEFQNFVVPPSQPSSMLALYAQNGTELTSWNLLSINGPTSTVYTFTGNEGQAYIQAKTNFGPVYQADFSFTPIAAPALLAPDMSVSCGNMQTANITPQIVQSGLPVTGTTLAIGNSPTYGKVSLSADGTHFIYTPTLGQTLVQDSFTYTATNGGTTSNTATVLVFIFTQYNCACNGDAGEFPSVSLDTLQRRLLVRMGMAAMPIPPPGMAEFANDFLKQAQWELYQAYRVFRSPRWFTWNLQQNQRFYDWTENVEVESMLVQPPVLTSVTPSTTGGSVPAGQTTYAITFVTDNGETTPSNPITVTNTGTTSSNTLAWPLSAQQIKATNIYRVAPNGPYGESQLYYVATVTNAITYVDTLAKVTSTQPVPNINGTSNCPKKMNPRRIIWVGISRGDNIWQPLFEGIDPTEYSPKIQAIPRRYEIRQCIEIWPAPSDNTWQLRIKADMNLLPFEAPTDTTSIDPAAIFLHALMMMKAHYGKPDAQAVAGALQQYIGNLVADTRSEHRAWPGKGVIMNAIPPKMAPQ